MESLTKPKNRRRKLPDQTEKEIKAATNTADMDTYLVYLGKIEQEEARVAAARKRLNKMWKLAINSGIVRKDMELVRKFADQDADTVLATLMRIKTYAEFMSLPAGQQMKFTEIPTGNILSGSEMGDRAYRSGYVLGITGKNPDEQAYPADNEHHEQHADGWRAGQKVLLDRIQPIDIAMDSDGKKGENSPADLDPDDRTDEQPEL